MKRLTSQVVYIFSGLVFFSTQLLAYQNQDIEFFLNENGFNTIIDEIEEQLLDGDGLRPIPDIQGTVNNRVDYELSGIKYLAKLDDFSIKPVKNFLNIDLSVKKVYVEAEKVGLRMTILGKEIRSVCENVAMSFDVEEARKLAGQFSSNVEEGMIKLYIQNVNYQLENKEIEIIGPKKCSGYLGSGFAVKLLVRIFLKRARELIGSELSKVLANIMKLIEEPLNDYAHQSFNFDIEGVEPLPPLRLNVMTKPAAVRIDSDGLRFAMDTDVRIGEKDVPAVPKSTFFPRALAPLGDIGIDPQLITDSLKAVFPEGVGYIELNALIPALNEYLTKATAAVVWPFLIDEELTEDYLKLFIRIDQMPLLSVNQDLGGIDINIENFMLKLQINRQNEWVDFFEIRSNIRATTIASIYQRRLSFMLDERQDYVVEGKFIGPFENQTNVEYDAEMADLVIGGALDFIHGSAPLIGIDIPITDIAGLKVAASGTQFLDRYIRVGIVESK